MWPYIALFMELSQGQTIPRQFLDPKAARVLHMYVYKTYSFYKVYLPIAFRGRTRSLRDMPNKGCVPFFMIAPLSLGRIQKIRQGEGALQRFY